jgi:hypothetical protein
MDASIKDYLWVIRLFPISWEVRNYYLLENVFFYDSTENEDFSRKEIGAYIPEKLLIGDPEQIEYVRNNWKRLLDNKIPVLKYENKQWQVDLSHDI